MSHVERYAVIRWTGWDNEVVSMERLPEVLQAENVKPWAVIENVTIETAFELLATLPEYSSGQPKSNVYNINMKRG